MILNVLLFNTIPGFSKEVKNTILNDYCIFTTILSVLNLINDIYSLNNFKFLIKSLK